MPILRAENELVLVGVEAVYAQAEVLTGADAIQCDIEITPMEAQQKTREFSRPFFGARPIIHTEVHRLARLQNIELAGSGDPALAPAWSRIFRGCGWAQVTTPTETTFNPITSGADSLTVNPVIDGEQFQLVGARGSITMEFVIGEFPKFEANVRGGWVDPQTLVSLPTPNFAAWQIPRSVSCEDTSAIDLGGTLYPFYELRIDQNATTEFYCVPGESGSRVEINARQIRGSVKLQAKQISEHDLFALIRSNVLLPVSMTHGTVAGEIIEVSGPAVQILNPRRADYKGDLAWECDMLWTPTGAGNNEIAVVSR